MNEKLEASLWVVAIIIIAAMLYAIPLMLLWNWLLPSLFGFKIIGFWQAMGIRTLASLIFQGINYQPKKN